MTMPADPSPALASVPAPVLAQPGYHLRLLRADDAPAWAAFAVLPAVKLHTSSTINSVADLLPHIERAAAPDPNAPLHFALCDEAARRLVGVVGFHTISTLNRTAEITYMLHPDAWGRGLATACTQAAVAWGFGVRQWVRIQGTVLEPNLASQRVLLKAGFEFEGRLRNFRIVRDLPRDYLLFAITP